MNLKRFTGAACLLLFVGTAQAGGNPDGLSLTETGNPGDFQIDLGPPGPAVFDLNYVAQNSISDFRATITYDPAILTPQVTTSPNVDGCLANLPASHSGPFSACTLFAPGEIRVTVSEFANAALPTTEPLGSITFDIDALAPIGATVVDLETTEVTDTANALLPNSSLATQDGSVVVPAPAGGFYNSTPAPGDQLDLGAAVVGNTAVPVDTLTVDNASADAFDITGFAIINPELGFDGAQAFPVSVPGAGSFAFDGTDGAEWTCTPSARGTLTGNFDVNHDAAGGAGSPVTYGFTCDGLSPNVQVPAGPVILAGLTVDPDPTGTFTVTNPQDGFTSDALNVTAAGGAGDTEITVTTGGPTTIAAGNDFDFGVSCDSTAAGSFSRTIDITWDNPLSGGPTSDSIDVNCEITDAVPSYLGAPASGSTITFPITTNGTTSAPIGIDVSNDGVGPSPDSDLEIISATPADAIQFSATINTSTIAISDGVVTDAITVTCSPSAGSTSPITTTLTVVHNGDDTDATYDLECPTAPDAVFNSDPAPLGTLNLGVVPPGSTTPEGFIDFSNDGAVDSLDVACTVTDAEGVFNFTPDPIDFTLNPGETESAGFQCTPPTPGSFTATLACDITGTAGPISTSYDVVCQGEPLVVPTLDRWGLLLMALFVLGIGGLAGRRMMA